SFARNEDVSVTVFNPEGKAIFTKSCITDNNGIKNVNISASRVLSPGNYYVVAKGNSSVARAKLLICK
ncbi:MAG: T9SS type A sorting domain-containing protein, partial [Draconibacterium sp.]|nr:T9SS type A sorting domain-containing protein [Draconibacterium sp.]